MIFPPPFRLRSGSDCPAVVRCPAWCGVTVSSVVSGFPRCSVDASVEGASSLNYPHVPSGSGPHPLRSGLSGPKMNVSYRRKKKMSTSIFKIYYTTTGEQIRVREPQAYACCRPDSPCNHWISRWTCCAAAGLPLRPTSCCCFCCICCCICCGVQAICAGTRRPGA